MDHDQSKSFHALTWLLLLPCIGYLTLIHLYAYNFPFLDDYVTVIGHALQPPLDQVKSWFLPHNEHLHLILKAAVSIDLWIFGEVNLIRLQWLGALFFGLFFCVLLKTQRDKHVPWLWLVPLPFLIFQPAYWGTMTWTTTSIHNFPGLLFALLTFLNWTSNRAWKHYIALVSLILALLTNGYGLAVVGILILWEAWNVWKYRIDHWHQKKVLLIGLLLILIAATSYRVALGELNLQANIDGNSPVEYLIYLSNFLGSCLHFFGSPWLNLLSVVLIASFVWFWRNGLWKIDPLLFLFICYLILSAILTTVARTDLGPDQGLASRYRIYSTLLVACSYLALVQLSWKSKSNKTLYLSAAISFSVIFYALSLSVNLNNLNKIKQRLIADERRWHAGEDIQEFLNPRDAKLYLDAADQAGVFPKKRP